MGMSYKSMLEEAKKNGVTSEKVMWAGIEDVDGLLCTVKELDKQKYYDFMRHAYGTLYSNHYATKEFAEWDVEQMCSTQTDGKKLEGQYWTCEQVYDAYKSMGKSVPSGVTKYDLYVAANSAKHDFGRKFSDEQVLEIAWLFYFADEDYPSGDKIYRYMNMVHGK